jgi:oxygen-independent coproporphyrinogen-3 oxidase
LYLHVPFCRNLCPYCPYTKVPYRRELTGPYAKAALAEVDLWADAVGPAEIASVYIGGGTPSVALDAVAAVLGRMRDRFVVSGEVCIETNPADVDARSVERIRQAGVTMVSLGVQSFRREGLEAVGRGYTPEVAERALALVAAAGFSSVNADIMFALPGQTAADVVEDLEHAARLGAGQITAYPLLTFPYTAVGEYCRLKGVQLPGLRVRHEHYRAVRQWCAANGFERVSVWGFKRGRAPRYSSVTRDGYLGIGPGAGSDLPDGFVLNTFDLDAWQNAIREDRLPIALRLPFSSGMAGWWWLYWRFYDTRIPLNVLDDRFDLDAGKARRWLRLLRVMRLAERRGGTIELTDAGAFWLHVAQNHFALSYVNAVWTAARRERWPGVVPI